MVFHGYENGFYNMGRQTLLQPIEWTNDGWFKIPEGIKTDEPIKILIHSDPDAAFSLNDAFEGNQLKPQWKFFGEYDTSRFHVFDHSLTLKGKGRDIVTSPPLLCIPSNHSYLVQVELFIEGDATGGLILFYNHQAYSGILANKENVLANLRGWQFPTEKNVLKNHVFLRLKNTNNTVDMYYSIDGENWVKIETSLEVSSYNHNALNGFLSLRIGLCAIGEGTVKFKHFTYTPI